jgi:hypothetical protein
VYSRYFVSMFNLHIVQSQLLAGWYKQFPCLKNKKNDNRRTLDCYFLSKSFGGNRGDNITFATKYHKIFGSRFKFHNNATVIRLFWIMSIPTTFRLFLVLTSNRQATSGVYAITVTTSAYHSRRCGRL